MVIAERNAMMRRTRGDVRGGGTEGTVAVGGGSLKRGWEGWFWPRMDTDETRMGKSPGFFIREYPCLSVVQLLSKTVERRCRTRQFWLDKERADLIETCVWQVA
jgi:hypothetical protein